MTTLLSLSGVTAFYGAIQALRGIDMTVERGEIVTLIGANGAGKSTLMMTICGNPRARSGHIVHDGTDITQWPTYEIMRRGIAQAPEGRRIFGRMTVYENLLMGAEVAGRSDSDALLEQVFTLFPRLKERIGQRGGTLSGGEQQMLAIGRALMTNPDCLIMDEPSEGLAPIIIQGLWDAIGKLKEQGLSILLVEQNAHLALKLVDYVHVMSKGQVVYSGKPEELKANDQIKSSYLGI